MFDKDRIHRNNVASADDFFGYGADQLEPVDLPELGGKVVYLRQLSAAEVREFIIGQNLQDQGVLTEETFTRQDLMISRSIVDAEGNPIFTNEQAHNLGSLDNRLHQRLANAVTAGMSTEEEIDEATSLEVVGDTTDESIL